MTYIEPLRRRMQQQVLLNLVRPYKSVTIAFISAELLLQEVHVLGLLVDMVANGRIVGQVDQLKGVFRLGVSSPAEQVLTKQAGAIGRLADAVAVASNEIIHRILI